MKRMAAGRKKNTEKREKVLETAVALFSEKGYSATSITDICNAAQINKPTLYYFFKDKRHLFFLCHLRSIESLMEPYIREASSIEDPLNRLRFMVKGYTKIICENPELKILIHETMSMTDDYFKKIREAWKEHYGLLRHTIKELQEGGVILTELSSSKAALFILGMITWVSFWFDYNRKESINEMAEAALSFALNGLSLGQKAPSLPINSKIPKQATIFQN